MRRAIGGLTLAALLLVAAPAAAEGIEPLSGHKILLVFLQLAAVLVIARLGSEVVKRLGLPSVVGELAAGILLGPTVLGHYLPGAFTALFPPDAEQFHLLEIISWLGMVLLLVLTGLETDVRLLRNLGRTALGASVFGMVVPFLFGLGLGWTMPNEYVANPDHRTIFALFLATALSISAMPVIAKILLDLDLTRRNIGVVILSAGVVDDTTGWIILSLIAGAATGGAKMGALVLSVGGTAVFLAVVVFVFFPLLRVLFRVTTDRFASKDTDLVLIFVVALLFGVATDALGVHAVFGAFVAGCVIRQVPRLRQETLHKLESVTFSMFAPVFFGMVGLKVDLWQLHDASMLLVVLGVATTGKLLGCTLGALFGGLRFWESLSIAVAMNARGAMGLVVAILGLSLGILSQEMYSIVVMMAVVTSFAAPLLLRLTMRMVRVTEDEAERMAAEEAKGLFDAAKLRVLVPTAGGPNALAAASIGMSLASRSAQPLTLLYVRKVSSLFDRILHPFPRSLEGQNLAQHLDTIVALAGTEIADVINAEAAKGYDLILVGASGSRGGVSGTKLEKLVEGCPCHVAMVKHRGGEVVPLRRVLVPVDGSFPSRVGIEFAVRHAEGVGEDAEVTLAVMLDPEAEPTALARRAGAADTYRRRANSVIMSVDTLSRDGGLEKLSPVFKSTKVKTHLMVPKGGPHAMLQEAASGKYDLVVLGAEHRAIHHRLFFGYENERLVDQAPVTVVLVVPKVAA
jgi:K+:H+ antiporter